MMLRVGERQRLGRLGDQADEAFAGAHRGEVDRFAVQAFGRVELEPAVGAQHIDRADLRDHVGGDVDDDLVEPRLRADRLRHDFAKPAQQQDGVRRERYASRSIPTRNATSSAGPSRQTPFTPYRKSARAALLMFPERILTAPAVRKRCRPSHAKTIPHFPPS